MSVNVQQRGKRFQLRVKHALLPRPFFFTFTTEGEARAYGEQLHGLLDRGIVPAELLATPKAEDPQVPVLIREYGKAARVAHSDEEVLDIVLGDVLGLRLSAVTFAWCEQYVMRLKRERNLAPGTIRKRVGSLARVLDWHIRRTTATGVALRARSMHPVRFGAITIDKGPAC